VSAKRRTKKGSKKAAAPSPPPFRPPSLPDYRRLFEAALRVASMGPWTWMEETELFAVRDPVDGELRFVSVMGNLGSYRAITVYPDRVALAQFWRMQDEIPDFGDASMLLETWQIQAAFGPKHELSRREKEVVRRLNLRGRGSGSWPHFLGFLPGWYPWDVDAEEARLLHALAQIPARPEVLRVRNPFLHACLDVLGQRIGTEVERVDDLPTAAMVRRQVEATLP